MVNSHLIKQKLITIVLGTKNILMRIPYYASVEQDLPFPNKPNRNLYVLDQTEWLDV